MAGPVVVQIVPERSAIDAYLASLRSAGITVPVNFVPAGAGFVSPNGQPAGNGSATPNTFGSPGNTYINAAQQFASSSFGPGTNNSFLSSTSTMTSPGNLIGSLPGMAGMLSPAQVAAQYAGPSGSNAGSAGMAGPQLGQAASQMLQAAQLMVQAAGGSQAVGGAPSAGVRQFQQLKAEEREYKATSARVDRNWEAVQWAQQKQADRLRTRYRDADRTFVPPDLVPPEPQYAGPLEEAAAAAGPGEAGAVAGRGPKGLRGIFNVNRIARIASVGYGAFEGYRMLEGIASLDTANQLSNQQFGGGTEGAAMAQRKNNLAFTESMPFSNILWHDNLIEDKLKIQRDEQVVRELSARGQMSSANELFESQTRHIIRQFSSNAVTTGYQREREAARNTVGDYDDEYSAQVAGLKAQIEAAAPQDLTTKRILRGQLEYLKAGNPQRRLAIKNAADVAISDVDRQESLRGADVRGGYKAMDLRAEYRFGEADTAKFEAELDSKQRHGDYLLGKHDRDTHLSNIKETEDRSAGERYQTSQQNAQTNIIDLRNSLQNRAAEMESVRVEASDAAKHAPNIEARMSILRNAISRQYSIDLNYSRRGDDMLERQGARNESLGIALHASDPRLGEIEASSNNVRRNAQFEAKSYMLNGDLSDSQKAAGRDAALQGGIMELQQRQRGYIRGFEPEELDSINQQATSGPGTANSGEALNAMAADIKTLQALLGQALPAITAALAPLAGVKS